MNLDRTLRFIVVLVWVCGVATGWFSHGPTKKPAAAVVTTTDDTLLVVASYIGANGQCQMKVSR